MGKPHLNISAKNVEFKRALTKEVGARNNVLKDVEKMLKADLRTSGLAIKRELGAKDRGVTVNGVYAFSQGPSGSGCFQQPFADFENAWAPWGPPLGAWWLRSRWFSCCVDAFGAVRSAVASAE